MDSIMMDSIAGLKINYPASKEMIDYSYAIFDRLKEVISFRLENIRTPYLTPAFSKYKGLTNSKIGYDKVFDNLSKTHSSFDWARVTLGCDTSVQELNYYGGFRYDIEDYYAVGLICFLAGKDVASISFEKDEVDIYDALEMICGYEEDDEDDKYGEFDDYKQSILSLIQDMKDAINKGETDNELYEAFCECFIEQFLIADFPIEVFYRNIDYFLNVLCQEGVERVHFCFQDDRLDNFLTNRSNYKSDVSDKLDSLLKDMRDTLTKMGADTIVFNYDNANYICVLFNEDEYDSELFEPVFELKLSLIYKYLDMLGIK